MGCAEDGDADAALDESLRHLLEVALGAAALGVVGVAPAEEGDMPAAELVVVSHSARTATAGRVTLSVRVSRVLRSRTRPVARRSARSVHLLREFRHEQSDPARFYTALAQRLGGRRCRSTPTSTGQLLLDVGGGPGYFRDAFEAAGATYVALDADVGELAGAGCDRRAHRHRQRHAAAVRATRRSTSATPPTCSSTSPEPWRMAEEMVRVTRPGGLVFISYTTWCGPWGGHETAPWHYLGGRRARRRYAARHGHEPKNKFGESLFAVTGRRRPALGRAASRTPTSCTCCRATTRGGAAGCCRVPVVREVVTWNLVLVLRKR